MYYFIINPHSKNGNGLKVWKKIEKWLEFGSVDYLAFMTEYAGQAAEYAEKLTKGCREAKIIVVIGGDGTVNEVLDGISFCGTITLGYIPAGPGYDLAKSLKLPRSPRKCLKKILHPRYYKLLDYGVITYGDDSVRHRRFIVSAGIGMDAAVCHNLLYSKAQSMFSRFNLARIRYPVIGIKQFWNAKPVKGYILLDGVKRVEFNYIYFISAQIHSSEGGGFYFAPSADYGDGKLDVCVVSHSSKGQLIPIFLNAFFKRQGKNKGVRNYQCREVKIHTDKPMAVHVDGESCQCQNELEIRCIERKIRMIV